MRQSKHRAGRVLAFVSAMLMTFTMMPAQSLAVIAETSGEIVDGTDAGTETDTPAEEGTPADGETSEQETVGGENEAAAALVTIRCNNSYVEGVTNNQKITADTNGTVSFSAGKSEQYASDDYALRVTWSAVDADGNTTTGDLTGTDGVYTISNMQADSAYTVNITLLAKVTVNAFAGVQMKNSGAISWTGENFIYTTMAVMGSIMTPQVTYDDNFELFLQDETGTTVTNLTVSEPRTLTCVRKLKSDRVTSDCTPQTVYGSSWIDVALSVPQGAAESVVITKPDGSQVDEVQKNTQNGKDVYSFSCDADETGEYTAVFSYANGIPLDYLFTVSSDQDILPPVFTEDMQIVNVNDTYTISGAAEDASGVTVYLVPNATANDPAALQRAIRDNTLLSVQTDEEGKFYFTAELEDEAITDYSIVAMDGSDHCNYDTVPCTASALSVTFDDVTYVNAANGVMVEFSPVTTEDGDTVIYSADPVEDIAALYNEYLLPAETTADGTAAEKEFTAGTIVTEALKITENDDAAYAYLLTKDASGSYVLTAEAEFAIDRVDTVGPGFDVEMIPNTTEERSTKKDVKFFIRNLADDTGDGECTLWYRMALLDESGSMLLDDNGNVVWGDAVQITDQENGVYTLTFTDAAQNGTYYIYAEDARENVGYGNGNAQPVPMYVNIDKAGIQFTATYEAEERTFFQKLVNTMSFGLFYQTEAEVVVTLEGDYSDISEYAWFLTDISDVSKLYFDWSDESAVKQNAGEDAVAVFTPITAEEIVDGTFSFTIPAQRSGYVAIAVYDDAGEGNYEDRNRQVGFVKAGDNATFIQFNTDSQPPEMPTVTLQAGGETLAEDTWTSETVSITLTDPSTSRNDANGEAQETITYYSGTNYFEYTIVPAEQGDAAPGEDAVWTVMNEESSFKVLHPNKTGEYYDANDVKYTTPALQKNNKYYVADMLTVAEQTNATYYFRTVSMTGLVSEPTAVKVRIQKDLPENGTLTVTGIEGANGWYVQDDAQLTFNAQGKESDYGIDSTLYYEIQPESGEVTNGSVPNAMKADEFLSDGVYTVTYWTQDEAGLQSAEETATIKVDKTAPSIGKIDLITSDNTQMSIISGQQGSAAFGKYFFKNAVTVVAEATDALSGVSLDYQLVKDYSQYSASGRWNPYPTAGKKIVPNEKFVIVIRATDAAGNVAYCNSEGIIVDSLAPVGETMAPEIDIIPAAANANGYYNGDVAVSIAVEDPEYTGTFAGEMDSYAGLSAVTYRVLIGDRVTQSGTLFDKNSGAHVTDKDGLVQSWNGSINVSSAYNNSNDVIVEVTATDNAGNARVSRTQAGQISIDTTAPVIVFDYNNDDVNTVGNVNYFDAPRTLEISITERSFDGSDVEVLINNVPVVLNWSQSGSGDNTVHTAQYVFDADDDYTFSVSYTDLAGNEASSVEPAAGTAAPYAFTIDTAKPVVTVEYDNNNAANDKYFQSGRTATVTVVEHNFSDCDIIVDSEVQSVQWESAGTDTYRASVAINAEGQHTFAVTCTDKAGNVALNGEVSYGESKAPTMFIIDKLDPELELSVYDEDNAATYTNSGHAIKGVVIPSVLLSDENYESHSCKLYRTRMNDINKDVTSTFLTELTQQADGSWYGEFDTFEKKQEYDGVYTLEVTAKDLSGRSTKKAITFSVNRFGSVYVYSEDLVNMQDTYQQTVDGNIVITEFNADELDPDSVKIEITRDSTPLTDVKFTPTPALDKGIAGDSGWYEYNYTIDASNFTEDGIYKIVVSSKDAAGNHSETTNYEDMAVLFRVDRTAPELVNVSGLEKNPINAESVEVGFEVFDAIGLAKITVFVDGEAVKEITEFDNQVTFSDTFQMTEGMNQHVTFLLEDKAGNQFDTGADEFDPAFKFEQIVTISTNFFIRWYTNPALFWGSIGGGAALIALIIALILKKRNRRQVTL